MSHPTWVRGLKQANTANTIQDTASHPTRVRGLKPLSDIMEWKSYLVAPYTGAWIETPTATQSEQ